MAPEEIKAILDQLNDAELKELRFYLPGHGVSRNKLDKAETSFELAHLLVQQYPEEASEVLRNVLCKMNQKNLAAKLGSCGTTPPAMEWIGTASPETVLDSNKHYLDRYDMSKKRVAFMMCVKESRPGAEKDIDIMKTWFDKLKFKTPLEECIDPLGQDIVKELTAFRDKINRSNEEISCCLIVLMSHGSTNGRIFGKDGKTADVEEILELFNNKQCPKLQQKPKIFIIQACRGSQRDPGVQADDEFMEPDDMPMQKLPTASDYFTVYSSQKGYVSFRNSKTGSMMITAMDQVFTERGRQWHIGDLFTKVNSLMVQKDILLRDNVSVKVTIVMESTLTKAVYLA